MKDKNTLIFHPILIAQVQVGQTLIYEQGVQLPFTLRPECPAFQKSHLHRPKQFLLPSVKIPLSPYFRLSRSRNQLCLPDCILLTHHILYEQFPYITFRTSYSVPGPLCCLKALNTQMHYSPDMWYPRNVFSFRILSAIWHNKQRATSCPPCKCVISCILTHTSRSDCSICCTRSCIIQGLCFWPFTEYVSRTPSDSSTVFTTEQLYVTYMVSPLTSYSKLASSANCTGKSPINVKPLSVIHRVSSTKQINTTACTGQATSSLHSSLVPVLSEKTLTYPRSDLWLLHSFSSHTVPTPRHVMFSSRPLPKCSECMPLPEDRLHVFFVW